MNLDKTFNYCSPHKYPRKLMKQNFEIQNAGKTRKVYSMCGNTAA